MSHTENIIKQVKELMAELLPENNMKITFNIPGKCDSKYVLKNKIKTEITEYI